jgi:hypothetical protein
VASSSRIRRLGAANPWQVRLTPPGTVHGPVMPALRARESDVMLGRDPRHGVVERAGRQPGFPVTPNELMARLSRLRRAQIGGKRAPHKPLLLLWLFGHFAATGSARATYAQAASPVSQLINDFAPPVSGPAWSGSARPCPFVPLDRDPVGPSRSPRQKGNSGRTRD